MANYKLLEIQIHIYLHIPVFYVDKTHTHPPSLLEPFNAHRCNDLAPYVKRFAALRNVICRIT